MDKNIDKTEDGLVTPLSLFDKLRAKYTESDPPDTAEAKTKAGLTDRFAHLPQLDDDDSDDEEEATQLAPFLFANSVTSISGSSGVGKSLFALDLSLRAIDNGYRVLYIDYEMGKRPVKSRLESYGRDETKLIGKLFYLFGPHGLPKFDGSDEALDFYKTMIDALKIDLVVIDTFSKIVEDEQSASSAERARRQLSQLRHHTAVLVVDSTFDDRGTLDISLIMKATRKKDHLAIKVEKDREDLIGATSWSIVRDRTPTLTHLIENDKEY